MPALSVRRRVPLLVVSGAIVSVIAACGSSSSGGKQPSTGGSPAAGNPVASSGDGVVSVTLTDGGCAPDVKSVPAGPITVKVHNENSTAVTEVELKSGDRIVGEKENLAAGFDGTFSLRVSPGDYTVACPGASQASFPLTVTGSGSAAPRTGQAGLDAATKDYASYISTQVKGLAEHVTPLATAIKAGKLSKARLAYAQARPFYERIEPVAESFAALDAQIDARINDVKRSQFQGFHYIERGLFQRKSTAGLSSYADGLLTHIATLKSKVSGLTYQPAELANGAVGLLDEVAKTKVTGEEERYSHIDMVDLQSNVEGSQQAFADLEPVLKSIDPQLASTIDSRFSALNSLLDNYRDPKALGGYVQYGKIKKTDVRKLADAVRAVSEPLAGVAAKVVSA